MSTISKRLKSLLKEKALTKKSVAEILNVSPDLVSKWCSENEKNNRDPSTEHLTKLADILNVTTDYLLGRTDIPYSLSDDNIIDLIDENKVDELFEKYGVSVEDKRYSIKEIKAIIQIARNIQKLNETL